MEDIISVFCKASGIGSHVRCDEFRVHKTRTLQTAQARGRLYPRPLHNVIDDTIDCT